MKEDKEITNKRIAIKLIADGFYIETVKSYQDTCVLIRSLKNRIKKDYPTKKVVRVGVKKEHLILLLVNKDEDDLCNTCIKALQSYRSFISV